jgi:NAD(P)-dependent dehydrogenase (short-subunit alcohol dehydrogenase family)
MADAAMSLEKKRVIVIGGTSGIGFAVATLCARRALSALDINDSVPSYRGISLNAG